MNGKHVTTLHSGCTCMWRDCTRCTQRYLSASGLTKSCPECRKRKKPRLSLGLISSRRVQARAPGAGSAQDTTATTSASLHAPAATVASTSQCALSRAPDDMPHSAPSPPGVDNLVAHDTNCDDRQAEREGGSSQMYEFSDCEDSEGRFPHVPDFVRGLRQCSNGHQEEQEQDEWKVNEDGIRWKYK